MCTILLSIKPEYVEKILEGSKLYEFRRSIARRTVDRILIYSSSPQQKVVGEVEVDKVLFNTPDKLWRMTRASAGISKRKYDEYFDGKDGAYAYKMGQVSVFTDPKPLSDFDIKVPPQSFVYLNRLPAR